MATLPYHLPVLSRFDLGLIRSPGPGLGNLLFPIARALISSRREGGTFVFPTMRQIKLGTYLRKERDKRSYGDILRARTALETIEWAGAQIEFLKRNGKPSSSLRTYSGLGKQFYDLQGYRELILEFLEMSSRHDIANIDYDIAIHIRRGDFAAPQRTSALQNTQSPTEWYVSALEHVIGNFIPGNPRVVVFSDDDPWAMIEEMGIDGAMAEPGGNALTSILLMSRAKVLIGSRSTFSLWAQFLGNSLGVWPAGFELQRYKPDDPRKDVFL